MLNVRNMAAKHCRTLQLRNLFSYGQSKVGFFTTGQSCWKFDI